jgi:hypothetical protein
MHSRRNVGLHMRRCNPAPLKTQVELEAKTLASLAGAVDAWAAFLCTVERGWAHLLLTRHIAHNPAPTGFLSVDELLLPNPVR